VIVRKYTERGGIISLLIITKKKKAALLIHSIGEKSRP